MCAELNYTLVTNKKYRHENQVVSQVPLNFTGRTIQEHISFMLLSCIHLLQNEQRHRQQIAVFYR